MIRRSILVLAALSLAFLALGDDRPRNIILIGWDGAQREHVLECLGRNELPNLRRISKESGLYEIDIVGITDTKAGWAQILTGYFPEKTGVYSNKEYGPIPIGYTVFERLEEHFGPDNIFTAAVIGKKGNVSADGPKKINVEKEQARLKKAAESGKNARKRNRRPKGKIVEENGVKYRLVPAKPFYNAKSKMDVFENGLSLDKKVGTRTLELLEQNKDKRFFFFVHFAEVDHSGHKHGENSKEYNDALISNDRWTGKIVDKLEKLGIYDNTIVYITADHGFDEGKKGHARAPYVFLGTNDKKVIRGGMRHDIAPTMLESFGLKIDKIEPALDGTSLTGSTKNGKIQQ